MELKKLSYRAFSSLCLRVSVANLFFKKLQKSQLQKQNYL